MKKGAIEVLLGAMLLLSPIVIVAAQEATRESESSTPSVLRAVAPVYPSVAVAAGATGKVVVEAKVNSVGTVIETRVVQGINLLGKAAEKSARQWIFSSAREGSTRNVRLSFSFVIMPREAPIEQTTAVFLPPFSIEIRARKPEVENVTNPNSQYSSKTARKRPSH